MAVDENPHSRSWPFRHSPTDTDGDRQSLRSIFVTDASRTLAFVERTLPAEHTVINIDGREVPTTSFHRRSIDDEDLAECPVCCCSVAPSEIKQMPCCSTSLCSACIVTHTITNIRNGKVKIECPACSEEMNSMSILYNSEIPTPLRERYQELLAQSLSEKQNTPIKLCPHCNYITILDDNDPMVNRKKTRRDSQAWIRCDQCNKEWCWPCYAPSHPNETCRQFRKNHTQLDMWAQARRSDNQQRNAQRCPKCSIYIEKIDGCDHMLCSKCNSKFCYRCGSRMRLPLYIGHDSKYSVFGCKYKLWPNCAPLRWLIRGSILLGVILLTPVALAALVVLVAIGVPALLIVACFGLPVYACVRCHKRS